MPESLHLSIQETSGGTQGVGVTSVCRLIYRHVCRRYAGTSARMRGHAASVCVGMRRYPVHIPARMALPRMASAHMLLADVTGTFVAGTSVVGMSGHDAGRGSRTTSTLDTDLCAVQEIGGLREMPSGKGTCRLCLE